jgi:hypothetical protein
MIKLRMFRVGTRMPAVWRREGQHLVPLKAFIENKASERRRLICSVRKLNVFDKLS